MASKDFIQKRIEGKKNEITKLEKKVARIIKAKESDWKNNPYYYHEDDLKYVQRDLDIAHQQLADYEDQLLKEIEKDNSRDVTVIIEFLNQWKERQFNFFSRHLRAYYIEKDTLGDIWRDLNAKYGYFIPDNEKNAYEEARISFYNKCHGTFEMVETKDYWGRTHKERIKVADGEWEFLDRYVSRSKSYEDAEDLLNKDLDADVKSKYDFIIERVNKICGTIRDASNLSIGDTGELNGIIVGERGTAAVKTIGAGGYNIQRFHFRTLIHEVKK